MSLANQLSQAGNPPERLEVSATVIMDERGGAHEIVASEVEVQATVPGLNRRIAPSDGRRSLLRATRWRTSPSVTPSARRNGIAFMKTRFGELSFRCSGKEYTGQKPAQRRWRKPLARC